MTCQNNTSYRLFRKQLENYIPQSVIQMGRTPKDKKKNVSQYVSLFRCCFSNFVGYRLALTQYLIGKVGWPYNTVTEYSLQVNNSSQNNRRTSTDGSSDQPIMKPSKSDSFLLAQVRNSELSGDSLSSEDTVNKSVSTTSVIPEDDGVPAKEQASEDSLIMHTTNNLNVTENQTANGEVPSPVQDVSSVSFKCV